MDIESLIKQADLLEANVRGWEQNALNRIARRIGQIEKLTPADIQSINNIAFVKKDMKEITKELARLTKTNVSEISKMYGDALAEIHKENQPLYDYRNVKFVPFEESKRLQAIVKAFSESTGRKMINLAKTKALLVLDVNGNVMGFQKYYTNVLDKAVMEVASGATDFHTAMRSTINEMGGSGIRIDYGGLTRRLDTVVRQNLLWGAKQTFSAYQDAIGEELGCDGIEIDWHSNPRPAHVFMQGRQFCIGKSRTIDGIHFSGTEDTVSPIDGKNVIESLSDYGCLHFKTSIICGVSEPRYSEEELKNLNKKNEQKYNVDGKEISGYQASQIMRKLETEVRKQQSTKELYKAKGNSEKEIAECNKKIKRLKEKYAEISKITGIMQEQKRMAIPYRKKN